MAVTDDRDALGTAWIQVCAIAAAQGGYLTRGQAVGTGLSERRLGDALCAGRVVRVRRDLLRLSGARTDAFDETAKWCAWYEGAAVVSHHSAAELHGLGSLRPAYLHVSAPDTVRPAVPRVAVHRVTLRDCDIEEAGAFRVTTPLRTLLDLAESGVSQNSLTEVVLDAVAIGRVRAAELRAVLGGLPPRVSSRLGVALSCL